MKELKVTILLQKYHLEKKQSCCSAEDDETLSFITKDHLELQGYEVHHCINGASP